MDEPRFFCPRLRTGPMTLSPEEARHALGSLRLREGDTITLFDGAGHVGRGHIAVAAGPRGSIVQVEVEAVLAAAAPPHRLSLIGAGFKGPRPDWLVEKCTELGATRLLISRFSRSVVKPEADRAQKLLRTAVEACKQSRRAWLPEILAGIDLRAALALALALDQPPPGGATPPHTSNGTALLVADLDPAAPSLASWLHGHGPTFAHLAVAIGPEGGLTDEERELLRDSGGQTVRLGPNVLRIETAAVAVTAQWSGRLTPRGDGT